jgi:predicted nucleic acid-binding Zn ribbon protein
LRRRTRSSSKAPIRSRKRSSTGSCTTSSSSIRRTTRRSTSSGPRPAIQNPQLDRPVSGEDLISSRSWSEGAGRRARAAARARHRSRDAAEGE